MGGNKFKVEIYYDRYDYTVRTTRNGSQWSSLTLDNIEQIESVAHAALEFVEAARKQLTTSQGQNTTGNNEQVIYNGGTSAIG